MNLTDLLRGKNIDPKQVLVFRHRPWEPELNKVLPWHRILDSRCKGTDAFPSLGKPSQDDSCGREICPGCDKNGYCTAAWEMQRGYHGDVGSSCFSGTWGQGSDLMPRYPPWLGEIRGLRLSGSRLRRSGCKVWGFRD